MKTSFYNIESKSLFYLIFGLGMIFGMIVYHNFPDVVIRFLDVLAYFARLILEAVSGLGSGRL
jgi:hypothetical protein